MLAIWQGMLNCKYIAFYIVESYMDEHVGLYCDKHWHKSTSGTPFDYLCIYK